MPTNSDPPTMEKSFSRLTAGKSSAVAKSSNNDIGDGGVNNEDYYGFPVESSQAQGYVGNTRKHKKCIAIGCNKQAVTDKKTKIKGLCKSHHATHAIHKMGESARSFITTAQQVESQGTSSNAAVAVDRGIVGGRSTQGGAAASVIDGTPAHMSASSSVASTATTTTVAVAPFCGAQTLTSATSTTTVIPASSGMQDTVDCFESSKVSGATHASHRGGESANSFITAGNWSTLDSLSGRSESDIPYYRSMVDQLQEELAAMNKENKRYQGMIKKQDKENKLLRQQLSTDTGSVSSNYTEESSPKMIVVNNKQRGAVDSSLAKGAGQGERESAAGSVVGLGSREGDHTPHSHHLCSTDYGCANNVSNNKQSLQQRLDNVNASKGGGKERNDDVIAGGGAKRDVSETVSFEQWKNPVCTFYEFVNCQFCFR